MQATHIARIFRITLALVAFPLASQAGGPPANLPPPLIAVRAEVVRIAEANAGRTDNLDEVRAQVEPLVAQLEAWFIANRPANEVQLTQSPWHNVWSDDPFANAPNVNQLKVYQVIRNGYYWNISENVAPFGVIPGLESYVYQNYLRGAYTIKNPPSRMNVGQPRLNVIALRFTRTLARPGFLEDGKLLELLASRAERQPGYGTEGFVPPDSGELWNRYIDSDLRLTASDTGDLYILKFQQVTGTPGRPVQLLPKP